MSALSRVVHVRAKLTERRWTWADDNRELIAANWTRRREQAPAIFNGRVLMVADLRLADGVARAEFFATDYADLLAWLDNGRPDPAVANGFGMGALQGSDDGFVLGEMAPHTANAGRLYFPCGTPDLDDLKDGSRVDLAGSLEREIREETGLDDRLYSVEPGWAIVRDQGLVAFIRTLRLRLSAEEARACILDNLGRQDAPELSDVVVVRGPDEIVAERMPGVVPIFLRDAFGAAGQDG